MKSQYPFNRLPVDTSVELSVVIPVYNESDLIENLLKEWNGAFAQMGLHHEFIVINDGSSDGTGRILDRLRKEMSSLRVLHQLNAGHGRAIRKGYEMARGKYILQLDANGRYEPSDFQSLWEAKNNMRLVIAQRTHRLDSLVRQSFSGLLRFTTKILFSVDLKDPNVPFRLFERDPLIRFLRTLPQGWQTTNLALAVFLAKELPERVLQVKVPYRHRSKGRNSTGLWALFGLATDYFGEMLRFRFLLKSTARQLATLKPATASN